MDSIVRKLSEIEEAAAAIVAHSESQKKVLERQYQNLQRNFDHSLELQTQKRIKKIQDELEHNKQTLLKKQAGELGDPIADLRRDYDEHHTQYAKDILKRITEV